MLLKLMEVYDEVNHGSNATGNKAFMVRDIVINTGTISFMREDAMMSVNMQSGMLPKELSDQKFTRISISRGNFGQDITVLGSLEHITSLLESEVPKKRTLKNLSGVLLKG